MDQRRYILFVLLSMFFFLVWIRLAPRVFPGMFPQPNPQKVVQPIGDDENSEPQVADADVNESTETTQNSNSDDQADPQQTPSSLAAFPNKTVVLGEEGFDAGYLIQAQINTQGGAVDWVALTDERYTTLDRKEQLKVIGNPVALPDGQRTPRSLELSLLQLDSQLKKFQTSLAEVDWEIVSQTPDEVTLRYPAPDGSLEIVRKFSVKIANTETRDTDPDGYLLEFDQQIRNLSGKKIETQYVLQGPIGIPLENTENTQSFREIDVATIDDPVNRDDISSIHLTARELAKQAKAAQGGGKPVVAYREPIHHAGLDVQFFTALLFPNRDREEQVESWFDEVQPQLLLEDEKEDRSDLSLVFNSKKFTIDAGGELQQSFRVFLGPKRNDLLRPLNAEGVVQLGWFSAVAKVMLSVLDFFHSIVGLPYAFAIIFLTVTVRGLMFPISKRQAIMAEKMKVLAPKLKEIQEKHKDKPEEFAKAYRAFQKKHNYNPMMGCLPALIQLPIFIGLYRSLYQAVDLRLARFLWIDNLAAPDAMFQLPFNIPFLGVNDFNMLPILTVILFVIQQKMFTPPPTSEEQAMTYKMMNYMMIVMGFLFYQVPAGLCLYFIASSLWGICERLLLKRQVGPQGEIEDSEVETPQQVKKVESTSKSDRGPSFLDRLRAAADEAQNAAQGGGAGSGNGRKYSKQKKNRKP